MLSKYDWRHEILTHRQQYTPDSAQQETIHTSLLSLLTVLSPKAILVYCPLMGEVPLLPLYQILYDQGILLAFPRILSKESKAMAFFLSSPDQWPTTASSSLWEPLSTEEFVPENSQPILVPSLALDYLGRRLGFGGGYYDRFLSQFPSLLKIAPQYSKYILETPLPLDPWDISMDIIVSDKQIHDFRK